jgi:O-antigen/teichoic acid export membrane protein
VPYAELVSDGDPDEPSGALPPPAHQGLLRRVVGFAGLPFIALTTPLLFLPVLARLAGAEAWLAIALGQSIGAFASLIVSLGYNTVGPTLVARAAGAERVEVLRRSLPARLMLFVPVTAVAVVIAILVAPASHRLEAALMCVALASAGLSQSWYMVGLGRVVLLLGYEFLPRLVATVAAASALVLTGAVILYPLLLIVAALGSSTVFALRTLRSSPPPVGPKPGIARVVRGNLSVMAIELAGGAYNSLAVTFVGAVAALGPAASYVTGDKLYRMGQYAASALGNATQGWVVEAGGEAFAARVRRALLAHVALGVTGFAAFALLGPWLSAFLFGATVAIDEVAALGFGVAAFGICVGTGLGRVVLVALGARREFLICVLLGASAGVPAILVLASAFGAAGGAWGLAIGEIVSTSAQAVFVAIRWSKSRSEPRPGSGPLPGPGAIG